ncbi:M20/M25/M40 family metallo-hydrolase [Acidiphilium sp. AL]|nr:M20/M25/M40 family metallo-hydrolase [Acidiphilium sp. AL]MCU4158911.1 M20/M25/M40 family metallo-hydrolase [Acidiphilium sp. AL]
MSDRNSGTTASVGLIEGGTRRNVVPAYARAGIDVRGATQPEMNRITRAVLGLAARNPKARLKIAGGTNRPPMERTPQIAALFEKAQEIAKELDIDLREAFVGGGSDGNFCAALGVPVLDGIGAVVGGAHARTEHVVMAEIPRRTTLLAALIEGFRLQ